MQTKFVRFTAAVREHFGGDEDALIELALLSRIMVFARVTSHVFALSPPGVDKPRPTNLLKSERVKLVGWHPVSYVDGVQALTNGVAKVKAVWYRDHSSCTEDKCEVPTFFDVPKSPEFDRKAWLISKPDFDLRRDDVWFGRRHIERALRTRATTPAPPAWPWGTHETDLLRKLSAAAERFWKHYDPAEPDTAPTNKVVAAWLVSRGVSGRTAEYIASILRADGLQPGPRR